MIRPRPFALIFALFGTLHAQQIDWNTQIRNKPAVLNAIPTDQLQYLRTQPNSGNNSTGQYVPLNFLVTSDYNFPAQSPTGSISPGSNTINVSPVPLGVNGTDTGHYVFIGTTGTPEPCLITGGTAVSKATSGTLIITCSGSHSAGYTVSSATAGIAEAMVIANAGAVIMLPTGYSLTYATTLVNKSVRLIGGTGTTTTANNGSTIVPEVNGMTVFKVTALNAQFDHFNIAWPSLQASGRDFDENGSINTNYSYIATINEYDTIYMTDAYGDTIDHCTFDFGHDAIRVFSSVADNTGPLITNNVFYSPITANAAIHHITTGGLVIANNGVHSLSAYGYLGEMTGLSSQVMISANTWDGQTVEAIRINPSSSTYFGFTITGNYCSNFTSSTFTCIDVVNTFAQHGTITGNFLMPYNVNTPPSTITGMLVNGFDWAISNNVIQHANTGIQSTSGDTITFGQMSLSDVTNPLGSFSGAVRITFQKPSPVTYAIMNGLPAVNGSEIYAMDANSTCTAGSSTGRTCFRENGAWTH